VAEKGKEVESCGNLLRTNIESGATLFKQACVLLVIIHIERNCIDEYASILHITI
jgi:hypothetical protein